MHWTMETAEAEQAMRDKIAQNKCIQRVQRPGLLARALGWCAEWLRSRARARSRNPLIERI